MKRIISKSNITNLLIAGLLVLNCCVHGNHSKSQFISENVKYSRAILAAAKKYNVPAALVTAVIHAESNFNPRARSYAGARGLMQINGCTQKFLKLKNVYDPHQNVHAGTRYLKILIDRFDGDVILAIAAYNAGPGNIKKYNGIPPYKETRKYIKKVLAFYDYYRGIGSISS